MAAKARSSTELLIPNKKLYYPTEQNIRISSVGQESSKNIWVEAEKLNKSKRISTKLVEVVYYISSPNGNLQHPHFMEISLPHSSQELHFRDVMNRLNELRGEGMADMYSWSSKRSYKNGYVWQDLSENDVIHPTNGKDEYVIKGSELIQHSYSKSSDTSASRNLPETKEAGRKVTAPPAPIAKRRNQSWSSFENPHTTAETRVYKCESSRGFAGIVAGTEKSEKRDENVLELCSEAGDVSNCSSEILDGVSACTDGDFRGGDRTVKHLSGRMKFSKVLMQFIRCGSVPLKGL